MTIIEDTDDVERLLSRPDTAAGQLQRILLTMLREHERDGSLPTNGRFLFYELVLLAIVSKESKERSDGKKGRRNDQNMTDALTHLREKGIVPWSWLDDETRSLEDYTGYPSIAAVVDGIGSKNEILPGLDCKGDGGYVVAPPSHGNYRWVDAKAAVQPMPPRLAQYLQGLFVKRQKGVALDADRDLELAQAALAVIPNDGVSWDEWSRIGMATYAATDGAGFDAFDEWSRKSSKYNAQTTAKRWEEISRSPPTLVGMGTLVYLADQASANWRPAKAVTHSWDEPDWSLLDDRRGELPEFPLDVIKPDGLRDWIERAALGSGTTRRTSPSRSSASPPACWAPLARCRPPKAGRPRSRCGRRRSGTRATGRLRGSTPRATPSACSNSTASRKLRRRGEITRQRCSARSSPWRRGKSSSKTR
jgi:hypothetical protein